MKHAIALIAGLIITANANAAMPALNLIYETAYSVDTFQLAPGSMLPQAANIGSVEISQNQKEVRLTVYHRPVCPVGSMCMQIIETPVSVTLPIVYMGAGICGGTVLVAEQDLRATDGSLISLQIVDDNGSTCGGDTTLVKRVQMTLTEQPARSTQTLVSQLSGFPTK